VSIFGLITIVFALVGAAIYLAIVYFAGKKGWWWLALLAILPAIMGLVAYYQMPPDMTTQASSPLFRHFGLVGIAQLLAGAFAYVIGRSRRADISDKGSN
jgi:uncharacterized membrane protein HdeD (DUF308 family)